MNSLVGGFLVVSRLFLKKVNTGVGSLRKLVSPPVMTLAFQPGTVVYGLRNNRHRTLELKETSEIASPSFIDEKTGVGG